MMANHLLKFQESGSSPKGTSPEGRSPGLCVFFAPTTRVAARGMEMKSWNAFYRHERPMLFLYRLFPIHLLQCPARNLHNAALAGSCTLHMQFDLGRTMT